jgi:hypothetical protein
MLAVKTPLICLQLKKYMKILSVHLQVTYKIIYLIFVKENKFLF